jgi:hypothetical protein
MQPFILTADQLDDLWTNPGFVLLFPPDRCQRCCKPLRFKLVKSGSPVDQLRDLGLDWSDAKDDAAALLDLEQELELKSSPNVWVRLENAHFDGLYNGKTVIVAERCPHCQTEFMVLLEKK